MSFAMTSLVNSIASEDDDDGDDNRFNLGEVNYEGNSYQEKGGEDGVAYSADELSIMHRTAVHISDGIMAGRTAGRNQ